MSPRYTHLGEVVIADQVRTAQLSQSQISTIILLLTASVALMMTGFGIILPIFPRRLAEFGAGVEALGIMTMTFALTQMIASPIAGGLADRLGRKPMILVALIAFVLANLAYLVANSTAAFIIIRAVAGGFTAGLFPAAMGVVADIVPEKERARWIGIVMGGYGAGFVFGPVLGGLLYDSWGYSSPFLASAAMALLALVAAFVLVPETRPAAVRRRDALRLRREQAITQAPDPSVWDILPRPVYFFLALLLVDFIGNFAFAYVEPQMVFYIYNTLDWTTAQFGLVVGGYGLAMMLGQVFLGQVSDRFGRKPVIVAGMALNLLLYPGMAFIGDFWTLFGVSVLAGLGMALLSPALSALYLDISQPQYRSRILGIKGSVLSLGGVLGPLLVAVTARFLTPQEIFLSAAGLMVISILVALFLLREPEKSVTAAGDPEWEIAQRRSMAAQASLSGIVLTARTARGVLKRL